MSAANAGEQQQVSKGLLITLGVVVALAAAVGLWMFVLQPLIAGDADDIALDDEVAAADEADPEDDTAADENGEDDADDEDAPSAESLEETVEVVSARDPFQQLVTEDDDGASPGAGDGDSDGDDGDDDEDDGDDDSSAEVGSTTVELVNIYTGDDGVERASVQVNDTGYDVAEGETFAERFQMLDIDGSCATMLFGDSRFTLCEGDTIRK